MNEPRHDDLEGMLGRGLFEFLPFNAAVIDREHNVVAANRIFEEYFGSWRGRRCFEICKSAARECESCNARATFEDGVVRVSDETGTDREGRARAFVVHTAPLRDATGEVRYVIVMTTHLTETRRWQREYDVLFERVPCYVSVIGRDFRIVRANEKFRDTFGDAPGHYCYELYKRRNKPCRDCPAALTFGDGAEHVSEQAGVRKDGSPAHYVVTTSPLLRGGEVAHVVEIASDITELLDLQNRLREARDYYESLIRNAATGILAVDNDGSVKIMNPAARGVLGWKQSYAPGAKVLRQMLPEDFFGDFGEPGCALEHREAAIRTADGREVPVRFTAVELGRRGRALGRAAFFEDLSEVKRLEQEKLEAERLGVVGQTVAGLAHSIKNLLMGLEGGMYMVDSGLRQGSADRITQGWEMLHRNFDKTTAMVKDFLSFAKGRLPQLRPAQPNEIAAGVVALYRDAAARQGVELAFEGGEHVGEAALDPQGMETCLTNLISNAIDAAVMREDNKGHVMLRTDDRNGDLIFEVIDNGCGMDWDVKGKVFTTFFTTKGGRGTGLGLLTTRKIVQEHGGRIEVESTPGQGSVFRIRLPRKRLEALAAAPVQDSKEGLQS